jgi:hypothetical protein
MAKVIFWMDTGANIKSAKESTELDTVQDLGLDEGEWEQLSDDDKYKHAEEWCWQNGLQVGYTES